MKEDYIKALIENVSIFLFNEFLFGVGERKVSHWELKQESYSSFSFVVFFLSGDKNTGIVHMSEDFRVAKVRTQRGTFSIPTQRLGLTICS